MTLIRAAIVFVVIVGGIYLFNSNGFDYNNFFSQEGFTEEEVVETGIVGDETEVAVEASSTGEATLGEAVSEEPSDAVVEDIQKVSTPEPLQIPHIDSGSTLTINGVIGWTNYWRLDDGLNLLDRDLVLDSIAAKKLADMFDNQYFAHESPVTGKEVGELAEDFSYEYVYVGENLALGNFGSDEKLVQAWMDSPGHRANILGEHYTEIGVAVGKGKFKGRDTWLAVQTFGTPLDVCPEVNESLMESIESNTVELGDLKKELEARLLEIKSTPKSDPDYNNIVNTYNALVSEYNELLAEQKGIIKTYNEQINTFNSCVSAL